jgi:hypothetical protein
MADLEANHFACEVILVGLHVLIPLRDDKSGRKMLQYKTAFRRPISR